MSRPRLTWKRVPRETGLAAVCQGTRGYDLRIDGVRVGGVGTIGRSDAQGWCWSVATNEQYGIAWRNSYAETHTGMPLEDAKAACKAYVVECLARNGGSHG